jgi:hypothetical protein
VLLTDSPQQIACVFAWLREDCSEVADTTEAGDHLLRADHSRPVVVRDPRNLGALERRPECGDLRSTRSARPRGGEDAVVDEGVHARLRFTQDDQFSRPDGHENFLGQVHREVTEVTTAEAVEPVGGDQVLPHDRFVAVREAGPLESDLVRYVHVMDDRQWRTVCTLAGSLAHHGRIGRDPVQLGERVGRSNRRSGDERRPRQPESLQHVVQRAASETMHEWSTVG